MTQLDLHPALPITSPVSTSPEPARWLMVLIPSTEIDLTTATRRILELAISKGARIRFIGLYENAIEELSLRRQLAAMSAITGAGGVFTETEFIAGRDWIEVVHSHWHQGDTVVCFAEQQAGRSGKSLATTLELRLDIPIYILTGSYLQKQARSHRLTQIFAWTGSIGIIIGFLLFQMQIDFLGTGWTNIIMLFSVAIEFWMLWLWNGLFN